MSLRDTDRFRIGDRVRVERDVRDGNPRTPHYLRGRVGTVVRRHGVVHNPLDHPAPYPPLYSVVFPVADVDVPDARNEVLADLHEEWLQPADAEVPTG